MTKLFVLDTNTIISAFLFAGSVSRKAYNLAFKKDLIVYSVNTLAEFAETLDKPKFDKYLPKYLRKDIVNEFRNNAFLIQHGVTITDCRDPKDNKFLELAIACSAELIVTGDKDLLILNPYRNIPIVTSSEFISLDTLR